MTNPEWVSGVLAGLVQMPGFVRARLTYKTTGAGMSMSEHWRAITAGQPLGGFDIPERGVRELDVVGWGFAPAKQCGPVELMGTVTLLMKNSGVDVPDVVVKTEDQGKGECLYRIDIAPGKQFAPAVDDDPPARF